ncbi:MAG: AAA family ATPase [Polyangiaceae bacterium]
MRIGAIETKGIRGLPDVQISLLDSAIGAPRSVTLVTGRNGSGKTALLRAIAWAWESVAASPPPSASLVVRDGESRGVLGAAWHLSSEEAQSAGRQCASIVESRWEVGRRASAEVGGEARLLFIGRPEKLGVGALEWVPAGAQLPLSKDLPLSDSSLATMLLTKGTKDAPDKYEPLLAALHDLAVRQSTAAVSLLDERGVAFRSQVPDTLETVKRNVATVCPDLRLESVEPRAGRRPLVWLHRRNGARAEMSDLSHGEKQGLFFAVLFAVVGFQRSIVLVDTPELYIHPAEHRAFFDAFCRLGTDNQLIVATTSPAILGSVPSEHIVDLSTLQNKGA